MKSEDESRKGGCLFGTIGLVLGFVAGFFFDAVIDPSARHGFGTDMRNALIKAFVGGVAGLVGGQFLGAYLSGKKGEYNDEPIANRPMRVGTTMRDSAGCFLRFGLALAGVSGQ